MVEAAEDRDVNIDDDQSNKRSLSNLFKEKENKGTSESGNTQPEAEPMKNETPETVKQELEPVTKNQETKGPEKPVEPGNIESSQPNEAKPAPEAATAVDVPETQNREPSAGETKDETQNREPSAGETKDETQNREPSAGETKDETVVGN